MMNWIILTLFIYQSLFSKRAACQITPSEKTQTHANPGTGGDGERVVRHGAPEGGPILHGGHSIDDHMTNKSKTITGKDSSSLESGHICHSNDDECIMEMALSTSWKVMILFTFWKTSSLLELAISCAVVFFLAIVNECLRFFQCQLHTRHLEYLTQANTTDGATVMASYGSVPSEACRLELEKMKNQPNRCASIFVSFAYSVHFMLKELLGVMLMLILMTLNIWLIISIVIGSGVGYVVTSHMTSWRRRCQRNTELRATDHR